MIDISRLYGASYSVAGKEAAKQPQGTGAFRRSMQEELLEINRRSAYAVSGRTKLTDEEIMAINWHMGGFDARARTDSHSLSDAWAKYPLAVMVHLADMEDTWLAGKGGKTE